MIDSILLEQVGKQESSFLHRNRHHHLEALLRLVLPELEQPLDRNTIKQLSRWEMSQLAEAQTCIRKTFEQT